MEVGHGVRGGQGLVQLGSEARVGQEGRQKGWWARLGKKKKKEIFLFMIFDSRN
jgi:hypothetical protein